MKLIINSNESFCSSHLRSAVSFITFFLIVALSSCQKHEEDFFPRDLPDGESLRSLPGSSCIPHNGESMTLYFGHKIFKRAYGAPNTETMVIENPDFNCYSGGFILYIKNGRDKRTRVPSAEIRIDGVLIAAPSDFSKNASAISKTISVLTPKSVLEVRLTGTPGSFIDLWIVGNMNSVTPAFAQIGPLCQNSTPPALPLSSTNIPAINGTWNPASINTATTGTTEYTFTPAKGQCAKTVTMDIEVIASIAPVFTQIGPLELNSAPPVLPATSDNGITGTWNPATINTSATGIFTYTFTPAASQCAVTATMNIEVINSGTISDNEGNLYKTVKIGDQWWMAENLKSAKFRNGDPIGTTTPAILNISAETAPEYQWAYNGDESNVPTYGRLYTWYAITDSRGVCPAGWHVPSDAEWTILQSYLILNGYNYDGTLIGNKIGKSLASTTNWVSSGNIGSVGNIDYPEKRNITGFSALPGGYRNTNGLFYNLTENSFWWSRTESINSSAWYWFLAVDKTNFNKTYFNKENGYSVRCLKD